MTLDHMKLLYMGLQKQVPPEEPEGLESFFFVATLKPPVSWRDLLRLILNRTCRMAMESVHI